MKRNEANNMQMKFTLIPLLMTRMNDLIFKSKITPEIAVRSLTLIVMVLLKWHLKRSLYALNTDTVLAQPLKYSPMSDYKPTTYIYWISCCPALVKAFEIQRK